MQLNESEIEDLIFKSLKKDHGLSLLQKGLELPFQKNFCFYGINPSVLWIRQLEIPPYGTIDLIGFYRLKGNLYADIYELKAVPIESKDFNQVFRYKKGIELYVENSFNSRVCINVNCVLIGAGFNSGEYIQNNTEITVCEFEYGLDGFVFNTHADSSWKVSGDHQLDFRKLSHFKSISSKKQRNGKEIYGY